MHVPGDWRGVQRSPYPVHGKRAWRTGCPSVSGDLSHAVSGNGHCKAGRLMPGRRCTFDASAAGVGRCGAGVSVSVSFLCVGGRARTGGRCHVRIL